MGHTRRHGSSSGGLYYKKFQGNFMLKVTQSFSREKTIYINQNLCRSLWPSVFQFDIFLSFALSKSRYVCLLRVFSCYSFLQPFSYVLSLPIYDSKTVLLTLYPVIDLPLLVEFTFVILEYPVFFSLYCWTLSLHHLSLPFFCQYIFICLKNKENSIFFLSSVKRPFL